MLCFVVLGQCFGPYHGLSVLCCYRLLCQTWGSLVTRKTFSVWCEAFECFHRADKSRVCRCKGWKQMRLGPENVPSRVSGLLT